MGSADRRDGGRYRFTPTEEGITRALGAAQAGIWEWDLDTNENHWSDEIWPLYGLDPGRHTPGYENWVLSIHPDDRQQVQRVVLATVRVRRPIEIEWRTNPDFGPVRWLISRGHPTRVRPNDAGHDEAHGYIGIVMDITARKEAEQALHTLNAELEQRVAERTQALSEQRRLLQTILDGVPGLISYWGIDLINQFANKAYSEWFGKRPEEIAGRHVSELLGPRLYEMNRAYIEGAMRGEAQHFHRDIPIPNQPGAYRISETHYLPDIHDGIVQGILAIVFDVTQAKQAERTAQAASQAKSDFLSNVSHELRTPLNAMFGLAQIGARDTNGTPTARVFRQIIESGQHLLALINDVLDFSKIEAGKMQVQHHPFQIGQVIEHLINMTALRAAAKGLNLVIDEAPSLPQRAQGDATRIGQVLVNLVTNAVKFTDHGEVRVRLNMQDSDVVIEVVDTGVGISESMLSELFQPFVQAHHDSHRHGGTGLGLAICKRLVQLMGGDITVDSRPQEGSVFTVRLPLQQASAADMRPLHGLLLIGLPIHQRQALMDALAQRHCVAHWSDHIPAALDPSMPVLVHEQALPHLDVTRLNQLIGSGYRVIVHMQASPHGPLAPMGVPLREDAVMLVGPLSPLRLLYALSHQPTHLQRTATRRLEGLRVLAAEDNPVNRLILAQMLETEGASVRFAFNGSQAIEQVRQQGPQAFDVVLCDIQMPVMDGYEATRLLREMAPALPVVGLTAHAFTQAREEAAQAGMVDYVTKPYMLDALVDVIRRHVRTEPGASTDALPMPRSLSALPHHEGPSDWQAMRDHFKAQPGLFDRLLVVASQCLPGVLAQLEQALLHRDPAELAKVAHEIKGIALNLRAPTLARLAASTQEQARHEQPECHDTAEALSEVLAQFLADMRERPLGSVDQAIGTDVAQDGRGNLLN